MPPLEVLVENVLPSPLPEAKAKAKTADDHDHPSHDNDSDGQWPLPTLKLRIEDLSHTAVDICAEALKPNEVLRTAVLAALKWLYTPETAPTNVKSITLVLCTLNGAIAHTSTSLDVDTGVSHTEIAFSLQYIEQNQHRAEDEVTGVLIHELAHWFFHRRFAEESYPEGFSRGIADYVRLKAGFGPPHWERRTPGRDARWDAGFETTAYFLEWIDGQYGAGTVRKINAALEAKQKYDEGVFEEVTKFSVAVLWKQYCDSVVIVEEELAESLEDLNLNAPVSWPIPKFNIRVEDLEHEGVDIFYDAVKPKEALTKSVLASFNCLYTLKTVPTNVKQILLVLRAMDGVAYTHGSKSHKEIHFSLDYIKHTKARAPDEIMGVLVHEVVHCYQHDGRGSCPGGLVEGMADFVRLKEGLAPPHWKRSAGGDWDAGYDKTAYFLEWIESTVGEGTIRKLNQRMKRDRYDDALFVELTGKPVEELWNDYRIFVKDRIPVEPIGNDDDDDDANNNTVSTQPK